jgi:hypothetical protein
LINIFAGKNKPTELNFLLLYFPFLYFLLILNYGITPSKQSPYLKGTSAAARQHRGYDISLFDDLPPPSGTAGMEIPNSKLVTCNSFFTSHFFFSSKV